MSDLTGLSIAKAKALLKEKQISSMELTQAFLNRIQKHNADLGAMLSIYEDHALKMAQNSDDQIAKNDIQNLTGIPIIPKDLYNYKGFETTAGSQILKNYVSPYHAQSLQNCLQEGAVILGKANLDEFAMGSSNENSSFYPAKNPWNFQKTPGGSSGGSAVCVAGDFCVAALGTDTGGSIRQPASYCSIVGLKPSYGLVSRRGVIAFASSLDCMGPMTKTVEDAAILLNVLAGYDEKDSTSAKVEKQDYTKNLNDDLKGLKVGIPKEYFEDGVAEDVKKSVWQAIEGLKTLGVQIVDVTLPHTKYAVATYYIIAPAEASSNLSRYDGVRFGKRENSNDLNEMYALTKAAGFGKEVKRRILTGTYVLSAGYYDAYYIKAQKVRTVIQNDFKNAFENVDVILGPVAPTTAFSLGEKTNDPVQMYMNDVLTVPISLAGLPALSVPCGFDSNDMPIGLQIVGKAFDENRILNVGQQIEKLLQISKKPSL